MVSAGVYIYSAAHRNAGASGRGVVQDVPTTIRSGIQKVNQKVSIAYYNSQLKKSAPPCNPLVLKVPIFW
jgi:hypothetical protein